MNIINVKGSYIDIHDNETVNLSVDGSKVSVNGKVMPTSGAEDNAPGSKDYEMCKELCTPKALELFAKLSTAGLLDEENGCPLGLTNNEKGMLANYLGQELHIEYQWKCFGALWGMSPDTLRSAYNKALEQTKSLAFQDKIKKITR